MTETKAAHASRGTGATLLAGILGRCPACGEGRLYAGFLTLAPACDKCGLNYGFADSGDGPAVFVILVTGFIIVGGALIVEVLYSPPYGLYALVVGPIATVLPLLLLRAFKGALIALQFKHKAAEGKLVTD
ncbi:MAG: DUF983 domain-containing protein [Methyloceanibacter sp.]|uniref:DUF983 domain-containing protein n=1 Tax=Methyloceanibacter sp. TaxID=1965321 RepID=UPI003D9B65C8